MHQYGNFFSSNPDKCKSQVSDFRHLIFFDTVFAQHLRIFVTFVAKSPIIG